MIGRDDDAPDDDETGDEGTLLDDDVERDELVEDGLEDDELLDAEVDDQTAVGCPYCGETTVISLDYGSGPVQEYVEDCEVCCRPWRVRVRYDRSGAAEVTIDPV